MHQILSLPSDGSSEEVNLIEQNPASVIFLTSASSDISTLSKTLELLEDKNRDFNIRALLLQELSLKEPLLPI